MFFVREKEIETNEKIDSENKEEIENVENVYLFIYKVFMKFVNRSKNC